MRECDALGSQVGFVNKIYQEQDIPGPFSTFVWGADYQEPGILSILGVLSYCQSENLELQTKKMSYEMFCNS